MNATAKNTVASAMTVTLFAGLERAFGFLYRVVLSRKLGAEGMGLYYIALSVFAVFITIAISGTPVAVSRLIVKYRAKEQPQKARGVLTAGILTVLCYSVPVTLLVFLLRNSLGWLFTDERCVDLLLFMMPGLIFTSVYAVLRGSFWSENRFTEYAVIELCEEIVMVAVGTVALHFAKNLAQGTKWVALAVSVSYFFSFSLALLLFFLHGGKFTSPQGTFRPLLSSALPVTGMRLANSLLNSVIAVLLPLRLMQVGFTSEQAVASYASCSAMAIPLLFAPSSIIGSISLVLLPRISEEFYKREKQFFTTVQKAIRLSVLLACVLLPLLFALGQPLCLFLYKDGTAGRIVGAFSPMLLPISVSIITTGLLNSMGYEKRTLLYFLCGSGLLFLSVILLPEFMGVASLAVGFTLSFCLTAVCNCVLLQKKTHSLHGIRRYLLCNALLCVFPALFGRLICNLCQQYLSLALTIPVTALCAFVFHAVLLYVFGILRFSALCLPDLRKRTETTA